jgi:fatty-acyl-CoA synthase
MLELWKITNLAQCRVETNCTLNSTILFFIRGYRGQKRNMHGLMMNYPLTLAQILEHTHRIHGDKRVRTVLPNGKMRGYTYAALYDRVKRLANAITELGIQRGDRVATYASNTYQHLELYYAIPCIGAVLHPLNVRLSAAQLARIVHEAEDKLIFVDGAFAEQFEVLRDKIGCKRIVHFNLMPTDTDAPYEKLLREAEPTYVWNIQDENWAMGLCYTSGTQGEPRGVLYTHRSMFLHTLAVNQADIFGLTEIDVVLPLVPMFHAMAWGLPYACMFAGADMVLPGPKPACLTNLIAENGITVAAGVPTVWAKAYPELRERRQDISSLRRLIVGGEAMSATLIEAYEKELGVEVCHAWGMTEMSPTGTFSKLRGVHQNLSDTKKWRIKAKQGRPVPGVELRLTTETSTAFTELPWDGETVGEVQVRSPWTASRYYKSESTTEHFTTDGWLRTGDLATIDAEGYMQIVDRAKALIRSGGESISSIALETALLKHPQVIEAAVIGVPDEKWGERPIAVVVPSEQTHKNISDALKQQLAAEFPKFWVPDRFVFVDEIPKTSVGKSDKQAILKMFTSNGKRVAVGSHASHPKGEIS